MNQYLAQLEQLAVPLAIAAVIFVFSLLSFGVWASRIRQVRAEVVGLDARLGAHQGSSREALALAETKTTDNELKFLLRETEAGLIDLPSQHGVRQGPGQRVTTMVRGLAAATAAAISARQQSSISARRAGWADGSGWIGVRPSGKGRKATSPTAARPGQAWGPTGAARAAT